MKHGVRIVCLATFLAVSACGDGRSGDGDSSDSTTSVPVDQQELIDAARLAYGAPGLVAVVRADGSQWNGVSGSADLAGSSLTDVTRFRVGSITKPIVAALVLDAVSRGDLSLDDTVNELLPELELSGPPTTIRMLLDHTSGIFNVGDEGDIMADIANLEDPVLRAEATDIANRYLAGEQVIVSDRLYVALAETHDRYFEPGTGYHYSNVNYQLAAMALVRATGAPLDELLRTRIVTPLGLQRTTLAPYDAASPDMRSYSMNPGEVAMTDLTDDWLSLGNGGSGGVISTADELLTVVQAMVSGELLDALLVADMKDATSQSRASYGLGLATYYLTCGTFYGHGGAIDGMQTIAVVSGDGSEGVVIAINLRTEQDPELLVLADALLCGRAVR